MSVSELTHLEFLVVDDSRDDVALFRRVLTKSRIVNNVNAASSAEEALSFLRVQKRLRPQQKFLAFIDLVMAPMDGLSLLQIIQSEKLAPGSFLIMLSGFSDMKLVNAGYQAGALTFLMKPVRIEDIADLRHSLKHVISVSEDEGTVRWSWLGESPSDSPVP